MDKKELKEEVKQFWDNNTCGTSLTDEERYTREYYEDIEEKRYQIHPEIFSFAQFPRYYGKKVLEVGIGAGTDFIQWIRSGADAYGIDITPEAIEHVRHRLNIYGLKANEIKVDDAENLSFHENTFDLVYSFGVIHHSPDTIKALEEIIRVLKPGGRAKIMVYHRNSLLAYFFWVKHALLKFRPWKSIDWVLWNYMESKGTKCYSVSEMENILKKYKINNIKVKPKFTYYDRLERFNWFMRKTASILAAILGHDRVGWSLTIEFNKNN